MSGWNGYDHDMKNTVATEEILESAIAGREDAGPGSELVTELVTAMRDEAERLGALGDVEAQVAAAVAAVPEAAAREPVTTKRSRSRRRSVRRVAAVLASVGALVLAMAGVGLADHAVPGDRLYGLDLALEKVGIGNGMAAERISEAIQLFESGHPGLALGHAAVTVGDLPEIAQAEDAKTALEEAADRIRTTGAAPEGVAELLEFLAANIGSGDGQAIAEIARGIKDTVDAGAPADVPPAPTAVPPTDVPADPPVSPPGRPGTPGG